MAREARLEKLYPQLSWWAIRALANRGCENIEDARAKEWTLKTRHVGVKTLAELQQWMKGIEYVPQPDGRVRIVPANKE